MSESVDMTIKRGGLYLSHEVHRRYFADVEAVILMRRDADLIVLPVVHAAGGGYLLKLRNSAGDRVANAADFFRANGIDDEDEINLRAQWSPDWTGLVAPSVFAAQI